MQTSGDNVEWMGPLPAAPGCDCRICRPDDGYDEQDRRTIDKVLTHGWQVTLVGAAPCEHPHHHDHDHGDDVDEGPDFAYTVGLGHRKDHPELLMSGLDHAVMHRALNDLATRVMAGRRFEPGDVVEDVLAGVPVVLERTSEEGLREAVTWAGWFHRRDPRALTVVWPTRGGVFAWQPGAPPVLDQAQPPGWREPSARRGGVEADPAWTFPVPADQLTFSCRHVVDEGGAVLWAARQRDLERVEDWTVHCGADSHESEDLRLTHLAHLVRSAPSLRALAGLGLDCEAGRTDVDSAWQVVPLA